MDFRRTALARMAFALVAAPLVLGLAACGKGDEAGQAATSGAPIAVVPPPAGKAWTDVVTKTAEGGYLMGNPDAPIKLVEFASLTCPHCAEFAATAGEELKGKFVASGRVSLEFRNFVRDPIDLTAAILTRCGAPESFFALSEQVFANQPAIFQRAQAAGEAAFTAAAAQPDNRRGVAIGELTGLTEFFSARGISRDQANACLADAAAAKALADGTQQQSEKYDITGTPTFLLNGEKLDINTWPDMKARLESMGAR